MRLIGNQPRLVYEVIKEQNIVRVLHMWAHTSKFFQSNIPQLINNSLYI